MGKGTSYDVVKCPPLRSYIATVFKRTKNKKICHILSCPQVLNNGHSHPGSPNIQAGWSLDPSAMSAVGRGVGDDGMSAVYLLTLVCGLSWTLVWPPEAKKIPPD